MSISIFFNSIFLPFRRTIQRTIHQLPSPQPQLDSAQIGCLRPATQNPTLTRRLQKIRTSLMMLLMIWLLALQLMERTKKGKISTTITTLSEFYYQFFYAGVNFSYAVIISDIPLKALLSDWPFISNIQRFGQGNCLLLYFILMIHDHYVQLLEFWFCTTFCHVLKKSINWNPKLC